MNRIILFTLCVVSFAPVLALGVGLRRLGQRGGEVCDAQVCKKRTRDATVKRLPKWKRVKVCLGNDDCCMYKSKPSRGCVALTEAFDDGKDKGYYTKTMKKRIMKKLNAKVEVCKTRYENFFPKHFKNKGKDLCEREKGFGPVDYCCELNEARDECVLSRNPLPDDIVRWC